jgi:ABC-type sugar transport system ATPase subunit
MSSGLIYVPRDRRAESLFPPLSIAENFGIATFGVDKRFGLLHWRSTRARLSRYAGLLRMQLPNSAQPITVLSGGNQQKVIVARWLASSPRILLLNDPTRGVDLGAKRDLYALLEQLTGQGAAVVMLSTEIDEHVELMDRVLVFREGSVSSIVPRERLTREILVSAFFSTPGADR